MKKISFILLLVIFSNITKTKAQALHNGECGIRFTYDAAGNLTLREFICNNTGGDMYRVADNKSKSNLTKPGKESFVNPPDKIVKNESEEIVKINALMPNPTTGKFMVRLADPIKDGNVILLDAGGKILQKRIESGNLLNFDISAQPSGMYLVKIESKGKIFTFKVIKE